MNWKKKTLLAVFGVTALVGVTAGASAESWNFFWSPQASYVSHHDNDGYYGRYYGRYDHHRYYRGYGNAYGSTYSRDYNRGYSGGYGNNPTYYGGDHWNRGYDNGYVQQDRGGYRSYGEHHHESDDDD